MNLFIKRFQEILTISKKTQNTICKEMGISKQKLSKWKTGYNEPNLDDLVLISQYFDVSADYLLGLETFDGSKTNINNSFNNVSNSNIHIK